MDEYLTDKELKDVKETRDGFSSQIDDIHKVELETSLKLQDRQIAWQNNIATACITLSTALLSLIFFSNKKPHLIFYVGIGVIFVTAILILFRHKIVFEKDMNIKSQISMRHELLLLKLMHQLNKALFQKSRREYEKFIDISNREVDQIFEQPKKSSRIAFWNDIYVSLFIFSTGLLSYQVWPFSRISYYIFIVSLFWILLGLAVYSYIDAKTSIQKTLDLKEEANKERKDFFEWRKGLIEEKRKNHN